MVDHYTHNLEVKGLEPGAKTEEIKSYSQGLVPTAQWLSTIRVILRSRVHVQPLFCTRCKDRGNKVQQSRVSVNSSVV